MRKTVFAILGAVTLFAFAGTAGAANVYPPGPGGTCPDTLKIFNIQNPLASCHPATLDTVLGVAGIITGFDAKASAYGFYMQDPSGVYAGIDVFTGATNHNAAGAGAGFNLSLGDKVAVYGTTQNFQGENEIEGPDVSQSTDDIFIRVISSANPLPAFVTGTTNTFRYLDTNTGNAQYAGMLVRIASPMRVARASLTGGMPFNSFMLVNQTGSATDSVLIEGNTLTTYTPPAVGTNVASVQGIVNHRTTGGSSWRIQLRDGNDIAVATPPNLADAYPIADDKVRVVFDRNVTTLSAETEGNYTLASTLGPPILATQVSGTTVDLTVSGAVAAQGDVDGVTTVGIVSTASGLTMTTPQSKSYVSRLCTPVDIQTPDPAYLAGSPCIDRSRYAGAGGVPGSLRVAFEGVSVGQFASLYYVEGVAGGPRNGVSVFGPTQPLDVGHKYLVVGNVQEFGTGALNGTETEIVSTVYIVDEGAAPFPAPIVQSVHVLQDTTCDNPVAQRFGTLTHLTTAEDFEGEVVEVMGGRITEEQNSGQPFFMSGPASTDTILVNNSQSSYTFDPDSAHCVNVMGILSSNSLSSRRWRILPRGNQDILDLGLNCGHPTGVIDDAPAAITFAVSPNPARTARVRFGLPVADDVDVSVFDVTGRKITTLAKGRYGPGTYTEKWSGLDSSGKPVGSGMFFYRLTIGGDVRTIRGIHLN